MTSSCKQCQASFEVTPEDEVFLQKLEVPAPTFCPDCRSQRRFLFRNDRNFYLRTCDLCQKAVISIVSTDKPYQVYCRDCYMSDKFDPLTYGVDFDFSRPFFEQFDAMRKKVPRVASYQTQSENSEFTVHSGKNKNCYIGSSLVECENVYYSDWAFYCKDSSDLYMCQNLERSYFCTDCDQCYEAFYLENSMGVNFSALCFDCRNSSHLLGCVGLRRKEYMILNEAVSKEDFEEALARFKKDQNYRNEIQARYIELRLKVPVKNFWEKNSENCSGNYITNSKNAQHVYNVKDLEDVRYAYEVGNLKDGMDVTRCANGEMLYEVKGAIDLKFSKFTNLCYQCSGMEYCDNCQSANNCFGCMGLKSNSYCILNKQYSPSDYAVLVEKIKNHMKKTAEYGEFFPAALSIYGYNETRAQDFYPLTKESALAKGYKWKDPDSKVYKTQNATFSEDIKEVPDSITNEVLACLSCGKNYKIIAQELTLYRSLGLSIPRFCGDCRHAAQMALQNPRRLWNRNCQNCSAAIQSTYSPERLEKVFCENCYLATIG